MKEYRRVFLSYAQADKSDVAQIAADLKQQGFEVWEYAQQWKESDLGHPVPEECAELMHRATYFVPVVSAASISPSNGKYTVMELDFALELDLIAQKRVFPVVLSGSRPRKWLKPYDMLESLSAVEVDPRDTRAFLLAMARLCRSMKVSYTPQFKERPLEPFWQGFAGEIEELRRTADDSWRLMPVIAEFKTNPRLNLSDLYYQLAEFNMFLSEPRKAAAIYEKYLLGPGVKTRQLMVRYARILRKSGDEKRMRIECGKMLDGMFPNPQTCEDFYYDGFAHFLLGNSEQARYDYERSRRFGSLYSQYE